MKAWPNDGHNKYFVFKNVCWYLVSIFCVVKNEIWPPRTQLVVIWTGFLYLKKTPLTLTLILNERHGQMMATTNLVW